MTQTQRGIEELKAAGLFDADSDYSGGIGESVKELLEVFGKQGHSGFSAQRTADIFRKLVRGDCLTTLKGTPDEWNEVGNGLYQNNRVSAVFAKGVNGEKAYWLDGIIFMNGRCGLTGRGSAIPIKFPWSMPKTKRRPYALKFLYEWRTTLFEMIGVK
jgi:hypothetical protein